jgi:hypothetical protein
MIVRQEDADDMLAGGIGAASETRHLFQGDELHEGRRDIRQLGFQVPIGGLRSPINPGAPTLLPNVPIAAGTCNR